jgi:serine/threonine-protein kinase HipA
MNETLSIELFRDGGWTCAAELRSIGMAGSPQQSTHLVYDFDYVADYIGERGFAAVSVRHPVDLQLTRLSAWPGFVVDLLPQGESRRIVDGRNRAAGREPTDWNALRLGAGNPVGNLRVPRLEVEPGEVLGVGRAAVVEQGDEFHAWARERGMATTGGTDTGGAAPKLLLTEDRDGLLYADGVLADADAQRHWIVKFPRGRTTRDAQVLANEAQYLEVARALGLRCGDPLDYEPGALFVPRFDREVSGSDVVRYGMESVYAALGIVTPGSSLGFEDVVRGLAGCLDDPEGDICELVSRDAVAWALGDTDNHGRNTALLKPPDGSVSLSPLFDFAPMFLDPGLVKRSTRWQSERPGEPPEWNDVCAVVEDLLPEAPIRIRLRKLGDALGGVVERMRVLGVDETLIERRASAILRVVAGLAKVEV